jgi:GDP-4-dehydro-6-deoxy-D-mannose reductase
MTGAFGFVGPHLLPALRSAFPRARLVASTGCGGDSLAADETLPLDLLDEDSITRCVAEARPDCVIHLAAQSAVPVSFAAPRETWRINVDGTMALARAIQESAPEALMLFVSSAEVYGLSFQRGVALDENAAVAPANPYAASKAAAEIALGEMALRGLKVLRLRPVNHTGPGQSGAFVVPAFAHQVARIEAGLREPVLKVGALDRWRDFLDVRDVCAAYVAAAARGPQAPPGAVINIASGRPRRIGDILAGLIARAGIDIAIETEEGRLRSTDIMSTVCDGGRAAELLGWRPKIPWDDTLDAVLDDWRARIRTGRDEQPEFASGPIRRPAAQRARK